MKRKPTRELRNPQLTDALQTQDMAAVAFALRHGPVVVATQRPGRRDSSLADRDVWTYHDAPTGKVALLLFSDAAHKPASLPPGVALQPPGWLRTYLRAHSETITCIFLDIGGPHPMQATIDDLLAALEA